MYVRTPVRVRVLASLSSVSVSNNQSCNWWEELIGQYVYTDSGSCLLVGVTVQCFSKL